jgi:hypothetical protein
MFNYVPDEYRDDPVFKHAMYTLAHRIKFGTVGTEGYLEVFLDFEFTVAREFLEFNLLDTAAGQEPVKDLMSLAFKFADFDLQLMTTTAVNATRLLDVPWVYFTKPFTQEKCLYSIFYENGLYLPQYANFCSLCFQIFPEVPVFLASSNVEPVSTDYGILVRLRFIFQNIIGVRLCSFKGIWFCLVRH